jgi:hypothetical protein
MRFPAFRVVLSAGSIAALLSLISAVAALAGDGPIPFPK